MLEIARHHYAHCLSINRCRCLGKMTMARGGGRGRVERIKGRGKQWARFNYRACKRKNPLISSAKPSIDPAPSLPFSPITSANSFPVGILGKSGTRPMLFHRVTSLLPDFIFFSFLPAYFLVYSFANATSYKRTPETTLPSSSSLFLPVFFPLSTFPSKSFVVKRCRISNGNESLYSSYNLQTFAYPIPDFRFLSLVHRSSCLKLICRFFPSRIKK